MWNKSKVVMLPIEKASNIHKIGNELGFTIKENNNPYAKQQNLLILSDEEIKEGDWLLTTETNNIYQADSIEYRVEYNIIENFGHSIYINSKKVLKIIASTDKSLGLPEPSKGFIEAYVKAYNEGNPITEVMVKYEKEWNTYIDDEIADSTFDYYLKVGKNNTITIRKIKDSWTREEHCTDMQYYMEYVQANGYVTPMQWLDELKHYE